MKFITKYLLGAAFLTAPFVCFGGGDGVDESRLTTIAYNATVYTYQDFEVAKSSFVGSVMCAASKEEALDKIEKIKSGIRGILEKNKLTSKAANFKFDFVVPYPTNPVFVNQAYDEGSKSNKSGFYDLCKKQELANYEKRPQVWSTQLNVSIALPLVDAGRLKVMVPEIEKLAKEDSTGFTSLTCSNASNEPYEKSVSDETASKIWKDLEAQAKEKALNKKVDDSVPSGNYPYKDVRLDEKQSGFSKGATSVQSMPSVVFTKGDDGKWGADLSLNHSFDVLFTADSLVSNVNTYDVNVTRQVSNDLYGQLTISGTQGCFKTSDEAKAALKEVRDTWKETLKKLQNNTDPETDSIVAGHVLAAKNPNSYQVLIKEDGNWVTKFYSACEPKVLFDDEYPSDKVWWTASFSHTIRSKDLDSLETKERDVTELNSQTLDRVDELVLRADFIPSIKQSVMLDLSDELSCAAKSKFLADKNGEFWRDSRTFDFTSACVVDAKNARQKSAFSPQGLGRNMMEESRYDDSGVDLDILPEEEGKQLFTGTYTLSYKVYWPLIESK